MTNFSTEIATAATGTALRVAGDVDVATADQFVEAGLSALRTNEHQDLAVDLADVTFMDSTGLGSLVVLHNNALEAGVRLILQRVPPQVQRLLAITGLDSVLGGSDTTPSGSSSEAASSST